VVVPATTTQQSVSPAIEGANTKEFFSFLFFPFFSFLISTLRIPTPLFSSWLLDGKFHWRTATATKLNGFGMLG
jgi:hypothetical protein